MRRPQHKVSVNIVRSILTIRKILRLNVAFGMWITNGRCAPARATGTRTSWGAAAGAAQSDPATTATARGTAWRSKSGPGTGRVSRRGISLR